MGATIQRLYESDGTRKITNSPASASVSLVCASFEVIWIVRTSEEVSLRLKSKPTFHHLYVVYDFSNKVVQERLKKFLYAGQSEEGKLLKEFYLIEEKNKL
ncbi:hypothetical protein GCM10022423_46990 [Flavobacterium ginsengiterrae]|uniref:Uncharacterized protein n=1 Tax=Flavobacterium ginsengiterrae TaxID=871695 RepID=A0ABP7H4G8_9FLAO